LGKNNRANKPLFYKQETNKFVSRLTRRKQAYLFDISKTNRGKRAPTQKDKKTTTIKIPTTTTK